MQRITESVSFSTPRFPIALLWLGAILGLLAGGGWLLLAPAGADQPEAATRYPMNDPIFAYSPGWHVSQAGADPREPADPGREPSGVVTFTVTGAEIDLLLALGDYWGYLYVTVDSQPTNELPLIGGNVNSLGQAAGYKTFYAPEQHTPSGPGEKWVTVQRGLSPSAAHQVRVEVWRSWGQRPLREVAVRTAPSTGWPRWPAVLLLVASFWSFVGLVITRSSILINRQIPHPRPRGTRAQVGEGTVQGQKKTHLLSSQRPPPPAGEGWGGAAVRVNAQAALPVTLTGMILIAFGVAWPQWWLVLPGLGLIGLAALTRPALWGAALLCGLPFYFRFPLPILPGRSLGLIEIGVWGGLLIIVARSLLSRLSQSIPRPYDNSSPYQGAGGAWARVGFITLAALISWALVATVAAEHFAVALREWRTVFLAAGLFALLLNHTRSNNHKDARHHRSLSTDHWLLITGWLTGATLVALVALWQYYADRDLITAEGVWRVRAFYGSPNNLALYLERTLAVTLALALLAGSTRTRLLWGGLGLIQGIALLLTFSKGALLLGLPAILATLGLGGLVILRQHGRSLRLLWWIGGAALLVGVALLPFVGTERFQRLLDFQQGTGFVRLNLWRSAWQMALDHPWLGVGPDNFLYQYRSNYLLPAAWQEPNLNHPHNWPLDWWTRLGLPGLVMALLFFTAISAGLWQKIRRGYQPALALGLLAALLGALAHGLIDASYALPDLMLVWVLMAYVASEPVE